MGHWAQSSFVSRLETCGFTAKIPVALMRRCIGEFEGALRAFKARTDRLILTGGYASGKSVTLGTALTPHKRSRMSFGMPPIQHPLAWPICNLSGAPFDRRSGVSRSSSKMDRHLRHYTLGKTQAEDQRLLGTVAGRRVLSCV